MILGGYEIKVNTHGFPQPLASGFDIVTKRLVGASYKPIAYLGSKIVNGTNHAVLCEQTILTGKDVRSLVVVVINQKIGDVRGETMSIVEIQTVLTNGNALGGYNIEPLTTIPEEVQKVFDKKFEGWVGSEVTPFALVASQMVNGIAYVFAATIKPVVSPSVGNITKVQLVKVYANRDQAPEFIDVIDGSSTDNKLLGAAKNDVSWP